MRFPNSKKRRYWFIAILSLIGACAISGWLASEPLIPPPNGGLVVDEKELDFGEVWEAQAFPWKFTVHNPTARDIEIQRFWESCSCAALKPEAVVLPARAKAELALKLNLSAAFWHPAHPNETNDQPRAKRAFETEIVPYISNSAFQKGWTVTGQVLQLLTVNPVAVDFGKNSEFVQPVAPRRVVIVSAVALSFIEPVSTSARFSASSKPLRTEPGDSDQFQLEIAPTRTLPIGRYSCSVKLTAVLKGGERVCATKEIPVEAEIAADIQASPPALTSGATTEGDERLDSM